MLYTSAVVLEPPHAHLTVTGELDLGSTRDVRRHVDLAVADGRTEITVDAQGVTFIDAAGLAPFVRLRNATVAGDGVLTFVGVSGAFARVCRMTNLEAAFGLAGV